MNAADPRLFERFRDWAFATIRPLSPFTQAPSPPEDEEKWRDWAMDVIQVQSLAKFQPPNPVVFSTWQEWALLFNEAVLL